ncbi:Uv excision repair protein rad23 [Striga asiatica]|uniref:Uv excision repair protein rad23 n=1 Tax=Striga asiatica TaxID=4170 RepID=A0A5A7PQH2_STRAF|nr:Uv excision repair protein rad23 [Striga asiatica]
MKIFVKTLKGITFDVEVKPEDTVADVKKTIEGTIESKEEHINIRPRSKCLSTKGNTLEENKVAEGSFVVVMLSKVKKQGTYREGSTTPNAPKIYEKLAYLVEVKSSFDFSLRWKYISFLWKQIFSGMHSNVNHCMLQTFCFFVFSL